MCLWLISYVILLYSHITPHVSERSDDDVQVLGAPSMGALQMECKSPVKGPTWKRNQIRPCWV